MCDNVSECMCTHLHHAHEHSLSFDSPYIPLMRWKKVCMWCAVFGFKCGRHASYPFIARDFACTRIHIGYVWISIVLSPNFSAFFFFRDEFPRMATIKHNKMYTYEFWKVAGNRAQMLNTCYVNFFHPHRTHTMDVPKNSSSVLCFDVLLDFDAIRAGILELCANSETMMILWPNIQCWRWRRACGR